MMAEVVAGKVENDMRKKKAAFHSTVINSLPNVF